MENTGFDLLQFSKLTKEEFIDNYDDFFKYFDPKIVGNRVREFIRHNDLKILEFAVSVGFNTRGDDFIQLKSGGDISLVKLYNIISRYDLHYDYFIGKTDECPECTVQPALDKTDDHIYWISSQVAFNAEQAKQFIDTILQTVFTKPASELKKITNNATFTSHLKLNPPKLNTFINIVMGTGLFRDKSKIPPKPQADLDQNPKQDNPDNNTENRVEQKATNKKNVDFEEVKQFLDMMDELNSQGQTYSLDCKDIEAPLLFKRLPRHDIVFRKTNTFTGHGYYHVFTKDKEHKVIILDEPSQAEPYTLIGYFICALYNFNRL